MSDPFDASAYQGVVNPLVADIHCHQSWIRTLRRQRRHAEVPEAYQRLQQMGEPFVQKVGEFIERHLRFAIQGLTALSDPDTPNPFDDVRQAVLEGASRAVSLPEAVKDGLALSVRSAILQRFCEAHAVYDLEVEKMRKALLKPLSIGPVAVLEPEPDQPPAVGAKSARRPGSIRPTERGIMTEDCLFFRCWPGFDFDQFPVDQFNSIADDKELFQALDSWARKEIRSPEVRRAIRQVARRRKQEWLAAAKKRRGAVASRPGGLSGRPIKKIRQAERRDPLVCRLGAYLGWWKKGVPDFCPFGPRVWFYRVPSGELVETIVSHLNGRTGLDYDGNEVEHEFRPRFGFVENADTALQVVAQRCINAIRRGETPDVRGSKWALAMGRKAMRIADEMLEAVAPPTPVEAVLTPPTAGQATVNVGSTPTAKPGEGQGGKNRRGARPKRETKELADFAAPLVEKGLGWGEIGDAYVAQHPNKAREYAGVKPGEPFEEDHKRKLYDKIRHAHNGPK